MDFEFIEFPNGSNFNSTYHLFNLLASSVSDLSLDFGIVIADCGFPGFKSSYNDSEFSLANYFK
jgi:hypothetical protein